GLRHSSPANDYEFVRRVYLDLIGRIPDPEEIQKFLQMGAQRRSRLIDKLLHDTTRIEKYKKSYSEMYAENWANLWSVWLLTRSANPVFREQMNDWLVGKFRNNASFKEIAYELITARGNTNDNGAVTYVISHLGEMTPGNKRAEEGNYEAVPITSRTTRLFLGLQIQCVQCHDHKFNPEWKQNSFWGMNVFFRQVKPVLKDSEQLYNPANRPQAGGMGPPVITLDDDRTRNPDGVVYYERRNGMILPTAATFVDGRKTNPTASMTRREQLAQMVIGHENFGKA